jgi:hypothetical protein
VARKFFKKKFKKRFHSANVRKHTQTVFALEAILNETDSAGGAGEVSEETVSEVFEEAYWEIPS